MSETVIGMLLGFGIVAVAVVVGFFVALVLKLRRTADELETFLKATSARLDRVVGDVEELKAAVEPLAEPLHEGLVHMSGLLEQLEGLGGSARRAADAIPSGAIGMGARIGTIAPILFSGLSYLLGKRRGKRRREKDDD